MSLTLLIGGARSGKTALGVDIGRRYSSKHAGPVSYVATAPRSDDDMKRRIELHQAERPDSWTTIEEKIDLASVIDAVPEGLIIIDCLTLWTSNMLWDGRNDRYIQERAALAAAAAAERTNPVVVVTNEVGLGIVPDNEVARRYRDVHGWVNQQWGRAAHTALHLVAGRATRLDDPWDHLSHIID